jgi:glucose-6-phosphate 1-dehydrogenase
MSTLTIHAVPFNPTIVRDTGHLARRKLLPALYRRNVADHLPANTSIFAAARNDMTTGACCTLAETTRCDFVPATEAAVRPLHPDGRAWRDVT